MAVEFLREKKFRHYAKAMEWERMRFGSGP